MPNINMPKPTKLSIMHSIVQTETGCRCEGCGMVFKNTKEDRELHSIMHHRISFVSHQTPMFVSMKTANSAYDISNDIMWSNTSFGNKLKAAENLIVAKWSLHTLGRLNGGSTGQEQSSKISKYAAEFIEVNENYFPEDVYEVLCAKYNVEKTFHTTLPIMKYDRIREGDFLGGRFEESEEQPADE